MFTLFLELGKQAGNALKAGMVAYKEAHGDISPEQLVPVMLRSVRGWDPTIKDRRVLTPSARAALAKGLAALAYNIAAADAGDKVI